MFTMTMLFLYEKCHVTTYKYNVSQQILSKGASLINISQRGQYGLNTLYKYFFHLIDDACLI